MTAQNKIQIQNINNGEDQAQTVEVLYQKMGDRWYAFSLVGDDVFMGSVTEEEINHAASARETIEKLIVDPMDFHHDSPEVA
jgi:hypothetical protein